MDSAGPAPDASTGPTTAPPPPGGPAAPTAPAGSASPAPAGTGPAASTPSAAPASSPSPPVRRGLFGSRGPLTPEQQERMLRQRLKALGVAIVALSLVFLWIFAPTIVYAAVDYPGFIETTARNAKGGAVELALTPVDTEWVVSLVGHGNQTVYLTATSDAEGKVRFDQAPYALMTVRAVHANRTTVEGLALLPANQTTSIQVNEGQAPSEWVGKVPSLPAAAFALPVLIVGVFAFGVVGGVGLFRRRMPRTVKAATILLTLGGAIFIMSPFALYAVVLVATAVWSFITVRRNPGLFVHGATPGTTA